MSTRASISTVNKDNSITSIYSHWDGYPQHLGKLLLEVYNTPAKLAKVLKLGDVSILYKSIAKPAGHTFDKPVEGYSVFYGRDRDEEGVESRTTTKAEFEKLYGEDSWCEYHYQMRDGTWYYGEKADNINKQLTIKECEREQ